MGLVSRRRKASRRASPGPPARPPAEVTVDAYAWGGKAVGRFSGKVVFVPAAVPGDKVLVRLQKEKSSYAEGRVEALLSPSPRRVEPRCKFFGHCGGCQWLAAAYDLQVEQKEAMTRQVLRGHLSGAEVLPLVPAEPHRGYRHRGNFHVRPSGSSLLTGFFMEGSHRVVNLDTCPLFSREFNERYGALRTALQREAAARALSGFTLLCGEEGDRYALHLRLREGEGEPRVRALAEASLSAGFTDLLVTPAFREEEVLLRHGDPTVTYAVEAGGRLLPLRASVRSFTQAHYGLNRILVKTALAWLSPSRGERVLDLYAGIGNFTFPLALAAGEVWAVEASRPAMEDARENARRLGISNVRHLEGDAARWGERLAAAGERFHAALLDPPRTGAREVLPFLLQMAPPRLLYVSCSLPCLERDLGGLESGGYRVRRLQPFDGFPQTYGVETLVLLER